VRPQSPHSPPSAPLVSFTAGFYRRLGAQRVKPFPPKPGAGKRHAPGAQEGRDLPKPFLDRLFRPRAGALEHV
jgi:hypothetical protein